GALSKYGIRHWLLLGLTCLLIPAHAVPAAAWPEELPQLFPPGTQFSSPRPPIGKTIPKDILDTQDPDKLIAWIRRQGVEVHSLPVREARKKTRGLTYSLPNGRRYILVSDWMPTEMKWQTLLHEWRHASGRFATTLGLEGPFCVEISDGLCQPNYWPNM